MLYGQGPMWQVPVGLGQRHEPGEVFSYSSGDTNVVSFLWQNTLGDELYINWLQREVYAPLALTEPLLEPDVAGFQVGSSFANLTARDWARVGQWWLDAWHGRDTLLSQDWQRRAVTPGVSAGGANYGLGFWLNTEQRIFPDLSENTFHSGGNSGQFVVVIPEAELVVVRLGLTLEESKSAMEPVLAALSDYFVRQMPKPTPAEKVASALP
jgi:CubicO group peptidase (beta-lactamase class C family)